MNIGKYRPLEEFDDARREFGRKLVELVRQNRADIGTDNVRVCAVIAQSKLCIIAPTWLKDEVERNMDKYKSLILAFMKRCDCNELVWYEVDAKANEWVVTPEEVYRMVFKKSTQKAIKK